MRRDFSGRSRSNGVNTQRRFVLLLGLLLAAGTTRGALLGIEEALELAPGDITLPVAATGQLVARPCPGCKPQLLRVDAATRYLLRPGTTPVNLAEFTRSTAQAAGRNAAAVFVYYDPQTLSVRRLVLNPGR